MIRELPRSLSPSKVAAFKSCPLAFRLSAIDRVPQPPSSPATLGSLVHRALELLFCEPPEARSPGRAQACLEEAHREFVAVAEYTELGLDADQEATFVDEAASLVARYFQLEDPASVRPIGLELMLEADLAGLRLRGIIDRLELDAAGDLIVTDYKTGRVPSVLSEQSRLGGVHFYAFLCEEVLGVRPKRIQLLYLSEPTAIIAEPSAQSTRALRARATAVWHAIERACLLDDFRPSPSPLCDWCSFHSLCPAQGGDPALLGAESSSMPTLPLAAASPGTA